MSPHEFSAALPQQPDGLFHLGRRKSRLGLLIIAMACVFFAVWGYHDEQRALFGIDLKPVYSGSRCLIAHCNPYDPQQQKAQYLSQGGDTRDLTAFRPYYASYPPTTLFLLIPVAVLPWPAAHLVWLVLIISCFVAAAFAMTDLCLPYSPLASTVGLALVIATSLKLVMLAQPATLAIGLCVLGVWCLVRHRYAGAGVFLFALSLALKPHLGAMVLLYFFLANRTYRKRAWQIAALTILLCLPGLVWASVMPESRHWVQDFRTNLTKGDLSDPGPADPQANDFTDLQAAISLLRNERPFYDRVSWLICGCCSWLGRTLQFG